MIKKFTFPSSFPPFYPLASHICKYKYLVLPKRKLSFPKDLDLQQSFPVKLYTLKANYAH